MARPLPAVVCVLSALTLCAQSQQSVDAANAMQRGDFLAAERILRAQVQLHPEDAWSLSLLGVALDNQKRLPEAEDYHRQAVAKSPRSAEILNNYGTHQWIAGQFEQAEISFSHALAAAPGYFNVLFNLGVMAANNGHFERAHEVLAAALRQQPDNVDVLYRLAFVEEATHQWESAVMRLALASKLDPSRADVWKLLAVTTEELGALDDSLAAWDRYLKGQPGDQTARRERAYTAARMGKLEEGAAALAQYVGANPDDPTGHYELAQAQKSTDLVQSMEHLDKALALQPDYLPARAARGALYYQEGKPEAALPDLEMVRAKKPDDAVNLDRLGQAYQALDRPADAVRVLRRAAELAPDDSQTIFHFARALADAGMSEESKIQMNRFRQLGPEQKNAVPAGLVEYLSLTPAQRQADYRTRVEKAAHDRPEDVAAQLAYLKLLLSEQKVEGAAAAAKRLAALKPPQTALSDGAHALMEAKQYLLARDFFEKAAAAGPHPADVDLGLALAEFRANGAKAGLELLARVPGADRKGDYYMARAQMLEAQGKTQDVISSIGESLRTEPQRPDLYREAIALLAKPGREAEALRITADGARRMPDNREAQLLRATTLEFARHSEDAERLFAEIQDRWPEWSAVWAAHGMVLASHRNYKEAQQALETAVALGADVPEVHFFLAEAYAASGKKQESAAERAKAPAGGTQADYMGRLFRGEIVISR